MKIKFTKFKLYDLLVKNYLDQIISNNSDINNDTIILLKSYIDKLNDIIYYMLDERFIPSKKKIKNSKAISGDLRQLLIKQGKIKPTDKIEYPVLIDVIKYFKLIENYILTRKDRSTELSTLRMGKFSAISNDCYDMLPKLLLAVEQSSCSNRKHILALMFSVACVYRQFSVTAVFDSSTITNEYSGTKSITNIMLDEFSHANVNAWLDSINIEVMKPFLRLLLYSGNASSPNGGASGINILADVMAVNNDSKLMTAIKEIAKQFEGNNEFLNLIDAMLKHGQSFGWSFDWSTDESGNKTLPYFDSKWDVIDPKNKDTLEHSRLVTFTAPGGKGRVIAIVDWLTQTALSAIHFSLFKLLSTLESDCTFNHPGGLDLYDPLAHAFISIDLSAATDRLPRLLQSRILECIFNRLNLDGKTIAEQWLILCDRSFSTKACAFEKQTKSMKYAVGQGMGMFSSWVSLAITHHYIVNHICKINRSDYKLVGDDLLIRNNLDGYAIYMNFMKSIGMGINQDKTIVSTNQNHTIEFARNYIIDGYKIESLPFGVAFAWLNNLVPIESVIWSHRLILNHNKLISLVQLLEGRVSHIKLILIIYYLFKHNIVPHGIITELINSNNQLTKFNTDILKDICEIVKKDKVTWHLSETGQFYSTLKSQCVMRKDDELIKACILAESLQLISYDDNAFISAANNLFWRLTQSQLISYRNEINGSPLTTKREKSLIIEYLGT